MPRQKRPDEAGAIYHALNRGNASQTVFHKDEDYRAFLSVLGEGMHRYPIDLFSFVLMPNHWHLGLRPREDGIMGQFLRWVTATHTQRHHANCHSSAEGQLYRSRFKSFAVAPDDHFLTVCRYVENNPLRAALVQQAEDWPYSSLHLRQQQPQFASKLLSPWPIPRPANWPKRVNEPIPPKQLRLLRTCAQRGRPFGSDEWVLAEAERTNLTHTLRPRGRPRRRSFPDEA